MTIASTATPSSETRLHISSTHFIRSGYINPPEGTLPSIGASGFYWSPTPLPTSSLQTDNFHLTPNITLSSYNSDRFYGLSLQRPRYISSMYFVRSGYIYLPSASLMYASVHGFIWSSSAHPANNQDALNLRLYSTIVYPSSNTTHSNGFTLQYSTK